MIGPSWGWECISSHSSSAAVELPVERGVREIAPAEESRGPRPARKKRRRAEPVSLAMLKEMQISTLGLLGLAEAARATGDFEQCELWGSVEEEAMRIAQNLQSFLGEMQRQWTEMN